ncbi:hypothetical protein AJ79_02350 [Helicocarpus griseus UAMH5409]|uniref:Uncharacterized protein n=1 Tax=Helicocarpus griseus UAMH5409 TaxID=1447875 RepID=A0A2B7Y409_9EURO|nr:hypothetical protein AJ79_02350 [Helicocarpus griseus UAMH5409]
MGSIDNGSKPAHPLKTPVFHHSLVTDDFDALKFQAASSLQLQQGLKYQDAASSSSHLITSPYNEEGHLLDLNTVDTANQLLAKALTVLKPIRQDYATAGYAESFNWQFVIDVLRDLAAAEGYEWKEQSFYVVTFRSILLASADPDRLTELDSHSHEEATTSGGLLKYWFGTKDQKLRNLATCIWRSREDARLGGLGPWHKHARAAARQMYEKIEFTTLRLVIGDGVDRWDIVDWKETA